MIILLGEDHLLQEIGIRCSLELKSWDWRTSLFFLAQSWCSGNVAVDVCERHLFYTTEYL